MNKKLVYVVSILIILTIAACGPAPEPTLSGADVANTAIAIAWTELAMTQAALPTATATLVPPTPTLMPTSTPFPTLPPALPTIDVNATSVADPCNEPMPAITKGTKVQVRFVNKSGGIVDLSFGLTQKNELGECGIYGFRVGEHESPVVEVLTGCYWAFAYVTGRKTSTAKSINDICLEAGEMRGITITSEVIGFD